MNARCCPRVAALWTNSRLSFKLAWPMLFQVFFGMTLSYLVFPGVLTAQKITLIDSEEWYNLLILGLFNIFDTVGRTLGGINSIMIGMNKMTYLHTFAFSRVLIVLLAILTEVGVFESVPELQNWLIILIPIILAVTNGYV